MQGVKASYTPRRFLRNGSKDTEVGACVGSYEVLVNLIDTIMRKALHLVHIPVLA